MSLSFFFIFFFGLHVDQFQFPPGITADSANLDRIISSRGGELNVKDLLFLSSFLISLCAWPLDNLNNEFPVRQCSYIVICIMRIIKIPPNENKTLV